MRAEILDRLSQLTEEERYIMSSEKPHLHSIYSKSGRFIIERRHVSHLSFGESTASISMRSHPRFREFPIHSHDYIEIMYVCNGSITHTIGDREVRLFTDELLLLGRDTRHSIAYTEQNDIAINLIVSADLFEALLNDIRKKSQLSVQMLEGLLDKKGNFFRVFRVSQNIAARNILESMINAVICEESINGYILEQSLSLLLCYLASMSEGDDSAQPQSSEESLRRKLQNYLHTSYSTATLSEAAAMMGLSMPYFSRTVSKLFGKSFKELLMEERFGIAKELLSTTKLSVGDIIEHIGYENSSYFHKEFKRRYGITPKQYRKSVELLGTKSN